MSNIYTGGPAFPTHVTDVKVPPDEALEILNRCQGMTLRDYFAAKAMSAMMSSPHFDANDSCILHEVSYAMADAMLEARKK